MEVQHTQIRNACVARTLPPQIIRYSNAALPSSPLHDAARAQQARVSGVCKA